MSKLKYFFILCFIAPLVGITGCASLGEYNPATGKNEFILISTDQEIAMGKETHEKLLQEYKLSTDAAKVARIEKVGQKIARVSDRQDMAYHYFLVDKNELNAFTIPGGNIYMFTGLYDKLKSDDEIAAVLGHETGHAAAKHTVKKFQAAVAYSVFGNIVMGAMSSESMLSKIASMSSDAVMNLVFSAYSRQDEYQADELGFKYMGLAGYDQQAMISTFEMLKRESQAGEPPAILLTHPHLDDRIVAIKKKIAEKQNK